MFTFSPNRLMQARKEIEKEHINQGTSQYFTESEYLENLIIQLVATKENNLKTKALALTNDDIIMVAGYLPYNYYRVDLKKLFQVCSFRSSEKVAETIYVQWQERFDNEECNALMQDLMEEDKFFKDKVEKLPIGKDRYKEILRSNDVIAEYILLLRDMKVKKNISLKECLEAVGVSSTSRICHELEVLFYTYCSKEDYLSISKQCLLDVINKYRKRELCLFLENFLKSFTLSELQDFDKIGLFLSLELGEFTGNKCRTYFANIANELFVKYKDWINTLKINQIFGNDERSLFWKQFRFVSVERTTQSDSVVMEFEDLYVTEFLGKSMGPIYFYQKGVFEKDFRWMYKAYKNQELRKKIYDIWKKQNNGLLSKNQIYNRLEHLPPSPGWQKDVSRYLINEDITEVIL